MVRILFCITYLILLIGCKEQPPEKTQNKDYTNNFRQLNKSEKQAYRTKAIQIYHSLLGRNFSGGVLVAKNGEIIFEDYNGYKDFEQKKVLTENTPIHIASVSKTFTAIAILKLYEQGALQLEDSVQKYFPSFPYSGITIQHLLTHRSGLPNYLYFMDTAWNKNVYATNNDVLQFMLQKHPAAYSLPNRGFHYCNTNFVLLALIIEKITKKTYPDYLQETIFDALNMKNSFVFSIKDTAHYIPSYQYNNKPYQLESFDCVYGDKNVYSTVRDLLLWDQALYNNHFIKASTIQKAFTPYSFEKEGNKNYGLGWRLYIDGTDTVVYHGGWWHGNNSLLTRLIQDTATIIAIGNKYNRGIYAINQMASIFSTDKMGELEF
ncbi:MAG: beta-lactamase family protein [Chitinophagaceae bacterium]|nr:beta-lactamase family protein [Chitinophagaceae bacterium]MCW5905120.1 beta-lactamase family protein [Chitinophagaceae bacterium]